MKRWTTTGGLSATPGEDRRPTLSWPRNLPIDGEPDEVVKVVTEYGNWLAQSDVPKLFINGDPGAIMIGRIREIIRSWPNQTELTVKGRKLLQEDSPDEIGAAIAEFVRRIRGSDDASAGTSNPNVVSILTKARSKQ